MAEPTREELTRWRIWATFGEFLGTKRNHTNTVILRLLDERDRLSACLQRTEEQDALRAVEVKGLRKALEEWRRDCYPCEATTCKCKSRWHMRIGPAAERIERTDVALEGRHE
jgi:hypothetical protein